MRVRYNPQAKNILNTSNCVLHKGLLKLRGEETIEIGMGNGEMLVQMAIAHPNKKFVGVEQSATFAAQATSLVCSANLKNLIVFPADAFFLPFYTKGFVRCVYLAFPDP